MPVSHDPRRFAGQTDTEKVQRAFDAAVKTHGEVDLGKKRYVLDRDIVVEAEPPDNLSFSVVGNMDWQNTRAAGGTKPKILVKEGKRVLFNRVMTVGVGIQFEAVQSSSWLTLEHCRVQAASVIGVLFTAPDEVDMCAVRVEHCEVQDCQVGFRFEGSNNLDPKFDQCVASYCNTGFDLRSGGSNAVLHGVSGTHTGTLVAINGGYQAEVLIQSAEHCETVVRTGGDDAAGYGQPGYQEFVILDARDCERLAEVNRAGVTRIVAHHMTPGMPIHVENRSSATALLILEGAAQKAPVIVKGDGKVETVPA